MPPEEQQSSASRRPRPRRAACANRQVLRRRDLMGARAVPLLRDDAARIIAACPNTPLRPPRRRPHHHHARSHAPRHRSRRTHLGRHHPPQRRPHTRHRPLIQNQPLPSSARHLRPLRRTARSCGDPTHPACSCSGLATKSIIYVIRRAGERAGIPDLSAHSCRRGAAQDMALAGESAERIMARGRWRKMTTAQRYIDETVPMLARGVSDSVLV